MRIRRLVRAVCLIILAGLAIQAVLAQTTWLGPAALPHEQVGVIDRIVDDALAVILIDGEREELLVPAGDLPVGARAGVWLILHQDASGALSFEIDHTRTAAALERIEAKLQALRNRGFGLTSP